MHVHLSCFALAGSAPAGEAGGGGEAADEGWLDAAGVVAFVGDTLPQLAGSGWGSSFPGALPPAQHAALAARKLTFFHGARPARGGGGRPGGRVRVRDLLAGAPLAELLDLHRSACCPDAHDEPQSTSADADAALAAAASGGGPLDNWFSAASAARVAALFAELCDERPPGCPHPPAISAAGLARLNGGTLSPLFSARLVEERGSAPGGGLSLADFVDFLLAWADRGAPASLRWLWPALDLRGAGGLSRADVRTLFDAVRTLWLERGQYPELRSEDVVAEVFDMLAPADAGLLTLADLIRRGRGGGGGNGGGSASAPPGGGAWGAGTGGTVAGAVVGLLSDVSCFWEHDSREAALQAAALAGQAAAAAAGVVQQREQQQEHATAAAAVTEEMVEGEGQEAGPVGEAPPAPASGSPARPWADVDPGWGGGEVGGRHETLRERAVRRAAAVAAEGAAAAASTSPAPPGSPPQAGGPAPLQPSPTPPWAFAAASPGSPSDSVGSEAWSDGFAVAGDDTPPRAGGGGGGGGGGGSASSAGFGEAAAGG